MRKKVIITYQAIVKAAPSEQVTLTNKVYWKSFSESGGKNHEILNYSYTINAGGTTTSTTTPILKITSMMKILWPQWPELSLRWLNVS